MSPPLDSEPAAAATGPGAEINAKITEQGNLVRDLKSKKADKGEIDAAVKVLLDLKVGLYYIFKILLSKTKYLKHLRILTNKIKLDVFLCFYFFLYNY